MPIDLLVHEDHDGESVNGFPWVKQNIHSVSWVNVMDSVHAYWLRGAVPRESSSLRGPGKRFRSCVSR